MLRRNFLKSIACAVIVPSIPMPIQPKYNIQGTVTGRMSSTTPLINRQFAKMVALGSMYGASIESLKKTTNTNFTGVDYELIETEFLKGIDYEELRELRKRKALLLQRNYEPL